MVNIALITIVLSSCALLLVSVCEILIVSQRRSFALQDYTVEPIGLRRMSARLQLPSYPSAARERSPILYRILSMYATNNASPFNGAEQDHTESAVVS